MTATEQDLADALARTASWLDDTATEVAERDAFVIDTLDKAIWAVRKIDQHRRRTKSRRRTFESPDRTTFAQRGYASSPAGSSRRPIRNEVALLPS